MIRKYKTRKENTNPRNKIPSEGGECKDKEVENRKYKEVNRRKLKYREGNT